MREAKSPADRRRVARGLLVAGLAAIPVVAVPVAASATPPVVSPDVVIAAGFGGGGNTGPQSYFARDFVELFNRGTAAVTLTGYSIQYVAPTNTTGNVSFTANIPTTTLQPGQHYLMLASSSGTTVGVEPAADLSVSNDIKRDTWTVYLVSKQTAISGDTDSAIKDELGVGPSLAAGTPKFAAGTPAPAVSNVTAAVRNGNGCTDTNNNAADFSIVTTDANFPLFNSASPATPCATASTNLPEAPAAGLLAVAGLASAGAATVVVRRRRGSASA